MEDKAKRGRSRSRSPHSSRSGSASRSPSRKKDSSKRKTSSKTESSGHNGGNRSTSNERKKILSKDTNSSDPRSVRRRVFVGNLGNVGKEEIIEHFQQYGDVVGVSIHANFGFVQYNNEKSADLAVEKTHGTNIFGKRVDCNIASDRRKPQAKDTDSDWPKKDRRHSPEEGRGRSLSPRDRDRYRRLPSPRSRYDELMRRDFPRTDDRDRDFEGRYDDNRGSAHPDERYSRRPDDDLAWSPPFRDDYRRGTDSFARLPPLPPARPPNDCEIVLASKETRSYGELIESRLRSIGVLSSIILPEPDAPLGEILEQVSRRGALYSVLITELNELHRSCTLNILHGTPQEHRNMPLEDALALVARNFESYLRALKDHGAFRSSSEDAGFKTSLVQDAEIASLLKLAAGGRILTVGEIDKLINALRKYRSEVESKNNPSTGNGSDAGDSKISSDFLSAAYPYGDSRGYGVTSYGLPQPTGLVSNIGYPHGYQTTFSGLKEQPVTTSLPGNLDRQPFSFGDLKPSPAT